MSVFVKRENIEYRVVIQFLFLQGNTAMQIKDELGSVYGVKFSTTEFKRGCRSLGDDKRSGRPKTATTDYNNAKVYQMVLNDPGIKVREIAEVMKMYKKRVLGMRTLSTRWGPHLLTLDQKQVRMNISSAMLVRFRRNKSEFFADCKGGSKRKQKRFIRLVK